MTKRKGNAWLSRQKKDMYVKASKQDGYRSRASYKLIELQNKYKLFKSGMRVIDLGAAPGGWSQVLSKQIGSTGKLWALDLLPINPISNVNIFQGDFTCEQVQQKLAESLEDTPVDWIVSDIAPNLSGCINIDQPKCMGLLENVWDFAQKHLKSQGSMLVKAFHGEGLDNYIRCLKQHFKTVSIKKPESSRSESREIYVLARGYNI